MRGLALDLAGRTGYALGPLGSIVEPRADTFADERYGHEFTVQQQTDFLVKIFANPATRPDVVAAEKPLPANAFRGGSANELALSQHGCLIALCHAYRIKLLRPSNGTWMKAFTGKGKWGSRSENKAAALRTAKMLRYLDEFERDADKADAAGIFHWLSAQYASEKVARAATMQIPF